MILLCKKVLEKHYYITLTDYISLVSKLVILNTRGTNSAITSFKDDMLLKVHGKNVISLYDLKYNTFDKYYPFRTCLSIYPVMFFSGSPC